MLYNKSLVIQAIWCVVKRSMCFILSWQRVTAGEVWLLILSYYFIIGCTFILCFLYMYLEIKIKC